MSLKLISVHILRASKTRTATGGKLPGALTDIAGSPFSARVYRASQTTVQRDEAAAGVATDDQMRRLSIMDPAAAVQIGDIAVVPADANPSTTEHARVLRVRRYGDRVQCDLETGVTP